MCRRLLASLGASLLLLLTQAAGADVLELSKDCGTTPAPPCFEDDIAGLLDEIHNPTGGRAVPSATNPVTVEVGPGTFDLSDLTIPYCDGVSNLTYRGAGIGSSVFTGGGWNNGSEGGTFAVELVDCGSVEFQHLAIVADGTSSVSGVRFQGDGTSRWRDVLIDAQIVAWYDKGSTSSDDSVHYWWDSKLVANPKATTPFFFGATLYGGSSTQSFFGCHLEADREPGAFAASFGNIYANADVQYEFFASRLFSRSQGQTWNVFLGPILGGGPAGANVNFHGGEIEIESTGGATALRTIAASIRSRGTRFTINGTTKQRIAVLGGSPTIDSPYSHGTGADPPVLPGSYSLEGQDTFLETDCSGTLCNDTSQGAEHHLLSFDPGCNTAGPWRDTKTGSCRGV